MKLAKFRKMAAYALSLTMLMSFTPSVAFGETAVAEGTKTFIDMPTNWATAGLEHAVANGLLKGYETAEGLQIRPGGNITRAELVTVVNRAFGASEKAALTGVTDVKNGAWYADEIAKAIGMQTMSKAEKVRPNDSITRQEAFAILARAYRQTGGTRNSFAKFTDSASVADFAVDGVGALVENGYVNGADGKLNPTGYLTRAEFAKIMDNLTAAYVNTTAAYSQNVTGNVIVNTPGAKLKDMKINGNLIIADGVGEGDVDVENVAITGDIIVKAGGENSIHIANVTVGGTLVVNKVGGAVRIVASGTTNVKMVEVGSDVIITATDLKGGEIGTVKIDGSDVSDVVLRGDFKTVETAVKDVKITANEGKIGEFVMTEKATVTGASTITTVKNETNEAVSVNGKTVEAGKSTSSGTTDTPAATGGSTGGGGGASGGGGTGGGSGSGGGTGTGGGGSTQPTTKYTITVSDTTNGTVTAAKTSNIEAGESVVITITPDANYQLKTITVNGVDKTSSVADGKLTVTVNENLTVAATFESTSTGGGGGQASENPAPDNFVLGGANTFAEGYPQINLETKKATIKMADAAKSEIFFVEAVGYRNGINPSSVDVIHGHDEEVNAPDKTGYCVISDTNEHEIDIDPNLSGINTERLDIAFVVKTGEKISATPRILTANAQATSEADTTAPWIARSWINAAKTKVFLEVTENVLLPENAKDLFSITGGASINSVTVKEFETTSGYKEYFLELEVTNCEAGQKVTYSGNAIKDAAGNEMQALVESNSPILPSAFSVKNAHFSPDRKYVEIKFTGTLLDGSYLYNKDLFTVKYGQTAETAQVIPANKIALAYDRAYEDGILISISRIEISNPPAAVENGKYFVEFNCQGGKNCGFDEVSAQNAAAEMFTAADIDPQPTVKKTSTGLEITFADGSMNLQNVLNNLLYCRFFITDKNGKTYKLRGSFPYVDGNKLLLGDYFNYPFPFDQAEFDWEGATLSYSNKIHPEITEHARQLLKANGNVYEEFLNIPITVE